MKFTDMKKGYAALNAGDWVGDIPLPLFDGIRLKVTRLWTPAYSALHDKLGEDVTDLSEADNEKRITDECLVQSVLLGWDGVEDAYSVDLARKMIADPDMGSVFRSAILYAAGHLADTIKANLAADEKN